MLEHYLIGTYTHHTSQGIYSVTLDTSAGRALTHPAWKYQFKNRFL